MSIRRLFILCLALAAPAASAHDFWLEPSTFAPKTGQNFTVSLLVGQNVAGDAVPRSSTLIDSFTVRDGGGQHAVNGFENQDPAGLLRLDRPGLAVIGYRSKPYALQLDAAKFEQFLREEGEERISALRARRGESGKPDRERFFRYAKAIVAANGDRRGDFATPLGYRLELVPEANPLTSPAVKVKVLFENEPLAGAQVVAMFRDDPSIRVVTRTDARGRAQLALGRAGVWLVKSVRVVAAPPGSGADWESLWASLIFERSAVK
jgi:uncharacterized GH25 family protein